MILVPYSLQNNNMPKKNIFLIYLLIFAIPLVGQDLIQYSGTAIFIQDENAEEVFWYVKGDTTLQPVGAYQFKKKNYTGVDGNVELVQMQTQVQQGVFEGPLDIYLFQIGFQIDHFDSIKIQSNTKGKKIHIKSKYKDGKPTEKWKIVYSNLTDTKDSVTLIYNINDLSWSGKSKDWSFGGRLDENGFMSGNWQWLNSHFDTTVLHYKKGILTNFKNNSRNQFSEILDREHKLVLNSDSIAPTDMTNKWIWYPSYDENQSIVIAQKPFQNILQESFLVYPLFDRLLGDIDFLKLPKIGNTGRIFYPIDSKTESVILNEIDKINIQDELLTEMIALPVFQLRRSSNDVCDSIITLAENKLIKSQKLIDYFRYFLTDTFRVLSPGFVSMYGNSDFERHEQILNFLINRTHLLEIENNQLINGLTETQEMLRLLGSMEELEEEWYFLVKDIESRVGQDSLSNFAKCVYNVHVERAFEKSKTAYENMDGLVQKKELLRQTVAYFRFFHDFFLHKTYLEIENFEPYFLKKYTEFLYNPYMGVNNIEVLVKKKFIQKVIQIYWPYLIQEIGNIEDGYLFITQFNDLLELKEKLANFAKDKGKEAKKTERLFIKAKTKSEMDDIFSQFFD